MATERPHDEEAPVVVQEWSVGPHAGPVTPAEPAHGGARAKECHARWVHLADARSFLTYMRGLDPDLHDSVLHLRNFSPHTTRRPLAHVRKLADGWLLVMTPTLWFTESDHQVHTGELGCLIGPDVVLTVESGDSRIYEQVLERLQMVGSPRGSGVQRVAVAVLLAIVSGASDVELALGEAVANVERVVFDAKVSDPVEWIYDLKREITEARRALLPFSAELPELVDPSDSPESDTVDRRILERIVSTVERIDRHLDAHDDLLSDMLQVHLSQVSVRQNEDMRKISAWAAILVYPTIVAGVYGMNFSHMPELGWTIGYPGALGLMAVGCAVLYRVFRRAGWL